MLGNNRFQNVWKYGIKGDGIMVLVVRTVSMILRSEKVTVHLPGERRVLWLIEEIRRRFNVGANSGKNVFRAMGGVPSRSKERGGVGKNLAGFSGGFNRNKSIVGGMKGRS